METAAIHYQGSSAPAQSIESTRVVTGVVRLSYAHIWQPQSFNGGTPKYSVSIIIPKSNRTTIEKIERAIAAAYREGSGKLKGAGRSVPPLSALKTPLRDGDLERPDDEAYANAFFLNATSNRAPQIVDLDCRGIDDEVLGLLPPEPKLPGTPLGELQVEPAPPAVWLPPPPSPLTLHSATPAPNKPPA